MLCPKISTSWKKLAPTGRHGRHVFATLVSQDLNVLCGQRFRQLSKSLDVHGDEMGGKLVLGDVQERAMVRVVHVHLE